MEEQLLGRKRLEQDARKIRTLIPQTIWLTTPLTSGSFDGDSFSDTANTLIDMSAVFGTPAGIRAVYLLVRINDEGSAAAGDTAYVRFTPTDAAQGIPVSCAGLTNDAVHRAARWVPCNEDGDIYYYINATGAGTFDLLIQVWGYQI